MGLHWLEGDIHNSTCADGAKGLPQSVAIQALVKLRQDSMSLVDGAILDYITGAFSDRGSNCQLAGHEGVSSSLEELHGGSKVGRTRLDQ